MSPGLVVLQVLAIFTGVWGWSIWIYSRVCRHVASMLQTPRMRWDPLRFAILLDGLWNGLPVRIQSCYLLPSRLTVTIRVGTGPPDFDAYLNRSRRLEFLSIRKDRIGNRILATVVEDELSMPGPPVRATVPAYFTPARVASIGVLLRELGWDRFERNGEGIGVSRLGAPSVRWKAEDACQEVLMALVELQKIGA